MKINTLFENKGKAVISYEVFPPKKDSPIEKIYSTLEALCAQHPDYISITYGAGGSQSKRTVEMASAIKNRYGVEPLAHLTALYHSKAEVLEYIDELKKCGIQNVLALRGDRVADAVEKNDFKHASDLAAFIKCNSDLNIVGACYPEGHYECESLDKDIDNLKIKVDAGVTHLNSQLFFDNGDYFKFLELVRAKGISVPIQAGIMPIVKSSQIERTVKMTGAKVPSGLSRIFAKYADNPTALMDAGIAYTINQAAELLAGGVDGVHFYIMNNDYVARRIREGIESLL